MSVCGRDRFFESVMTTGYVRASWRRFLTDYGTWLSGVVQAAEAKPAVDCSLVDLNGSPKMLLKDYVDKLPKGMPIILNFGSYT